MIFFASYHNLTGVEKAGKKQTFYYDSGVSILEEEGAYHYYLNDELGSPVRVSGYGGEETAGISNYHSYGYDEFGNDLSEALTEAGILSPYTEQGEYQPFGYTGYRYDTISSTFFAQAREYQPKTGRFMAEDVIKGNGLVPETLNPYAYCFNNPLKWNDKNGFYPNYMTTEENISDANVDVTGNSVCNISNRTANILINEKSLLKSSANSLNLGIDEFGENMLSGVELDNIISEVKTESNSEEIFTKEAGNSNQKKGVISIAVSGTIGAGGKATGALQVTIDAHGNIQVQLAEGAGVSAGESVAGHFVVTLYPDTDDVYDTKGFSTVMGISGGLGWFGGVDAIFFGEGNSIKPAGIAFTLGFGEGIEGHVYMTNTDELVTFNLFEMLGVNECIE